MEKSIKKILSVDQAAQRAVDLQKKNKTIVLAGGCFDVLHRGHVAFLQKAKEQGDILLVLLEHDDRIKKWKGPTRPVNNQQDRAYILAHMTPVDYVVLLPAVMDNKAYDTLVNQLKPAIIATTAGDRNRGHKERQAKQIGARVIDVTPMIENQSTTNVLAILQD
ncbi:MAG: adenylyltransferase/cytidyltransferase family protein [Patescibacteria group bacterium]